jgi:hypothetical protein
MDEKKYNDILSTYRRGVEFTLITNRGQGDLSNEVILDYVSEDKGKLIPKLRFINGGAIFDPKAIGGVERIIDLVESPNGQC